MKNYKIAAIPADGIGQEVISAGVNVLQALTKQMGTFNIDFEYFDWGTDRYKETGLLMPEDGAE